MADDAARRIGPYEIQAELGRGGMARVHLARQSSLNRLVALKELGGFFAADVAMVERFLREAQVAGSLSHPNLVAVYDTFQVDGVPFIAMEYLSAGSLRPWVGRLCFEQVGGVLEGVLAGLAHAHAAGIVHRDLKPENLLIGADGRIKIGDFGIAKAVDETATAALTGTGSAVGTPAYMSPEQATAEPVVPQTDLYAVGVIAYELLCGTVPFAGGTPMSVLLRHVNDPPPPIGGHVTGVPPALVAWVDRLLAKRPSDRPASAKLAAEALEDVMVDVAGSKWRRQALLEGAPEAVQRRSPTPPTLVRVPSPPPSIGAPPLHAPSAPIEPTHVIVDEELAATPPDQAQTVHAAASTARRTRPRRRGLLVGGGLAALVLVGGGIALAAGGGGGDHPKAGTTTRAASPRPSATPITFQGLVADGQGDPDAITPPTDPGLDNAPHTAVDRRLADIISDETDLPTPNGDAQSPYAVCTRRSQLPHGATAQLVCKASGVSVTFTRFLTASALRAYTKAQTAGLPATGITGCPDDGYWSDTDADGTSHDRGKMRARLVGGRVRDYWTYDNRRVAAQMTGPRRHGKTLCRKTWESVA